MQMQHKGEKMSDFNSVLTLQKMVFDRIEFDRKGFKNNEELKFELQDEYSIVISLSGFFAVETQEELDDKMVQTLINKNAVAILMPYLRSELTLLTAQPDTDSVVLPPFNINKMFSN